MDGACGQVTIAWQNNTCREVAWPGLDGAEMPTQEQILHGPAVDHDIAEGVDKHHTVKLHKAPEIQLV